MALPSIFKNMNLFLEGVGYQGKIEEIETPKLAIKTEEFSAGGMGSSVDIDMGLEKLETSLTFGGFIAELAKKFGAVGVDGLKLRLMGAFENDETLKTDSVEITLRGRMKELELGNWKRAENASFKTMLPLAYYKLAVNGETLIEIDVLGMKFFVDGKDRYAEMRAALGM